MADDSDKQSQIEQDVRECDEVLHCVAKIDAFSNDSRSRILKEVVSHFGDWREALTHAEEAASDTVQRCLTTRPDNLLKKWRQETNPGRLSTYLNRSAVWTAGEKAKSRGHQMRTRSEEMDELEKTAPAKEHALRASGNAATPAAIGRQAGLIAAWCAESVRRWPHEHAIMAMTILWDVGQESAGHVLLPGLKKDALSHRLRPVRESFRDELCHKVRGDLMSEVQADFPQALFGLLPDAAIPELTADEKREVRRLIDGKADDEAWSASWRERFSRDYAAAAWLAACLRAAVPSKNGGARTAGKTVPVELGTKLTGLRVTIDAAVAESFSLLTPLEAGLMVPTDFQSLFSAVLLQTGADEGTLWIADDAREHLVAAYNPVENHPIIGQAQMIYDGIVSLDDVGRKIRETQLRRTLPQRSGIVCMAYKLRCSMNISDVKAEKMHSEKMDLITGMTTHAMIVLPFICAGEMKGVLSFVKLKPDAEPFGEGDEHAAQALGQLLARSIEHNIAQRLTA